MNGLQRILRHTDYMSARAGSGEIMIRIWLEDKINEEAKPHINLPEIESSTLEESSRYFTLEDLVISNEDTKLHMELPKIKYSASVDTYYFALDNFLWMEINL